MAKKCVKDIFCILNHCLIVPEIKRNKQFKIQRAYSIYIIFLIIIYFYFFFTSKQLIIDVTNRIGPGMQRVLQCS